MAALGDWLTVKEAAALTGYNPEQIKRLARNGAIEAQKWDRSWMISKTSLLDYMATRGHGPQPRISL